MKLNPGYLFLGVIALASLAPINGVAQTAQVIEGSVGLITEDFVMINGGKYSIVRANSSGGSATECRVGAAKSACGALAAVGSIKQARITVSGNIATLIEVLDLGR
jgi:hypothetical protein